MAQTFEGAVPADSPHVELTNAATLGDPRDIPQPFPCQENRLDLRPYQRDVIARLNAEVSAGRRRVAVVGATGSGKTVIAAEVARGAVCEGKGVLIFSHRREIVGQTSMKLHAAGIDHGIIQAGFPTRPGERVQVASIQTLHARAIRGSGMELPTADLVIVDEAHHVRARSYQRLLAAYPGAVVVGLTATPCRGDGRGLGNVFETIVEGPPVAELIAGDYLVPPLVFAPVQPDLKGIKIVRGDYVERQLAARMDKAHLVGDIVAHWHRLAERRRTVVFATGVGHSVHLRDEFRRSGVLAEHIDGTTPSEERHAILAKLAAGTVEVVTNAMVLTEGWDCPEVACLVLARPTKHMGLHRQMVGRVLRPAPGKINALILDHAGAVFEHGFIDEPVVWTLNKDKRAENPAHNSRAQRRMPALTNCPECTAVRFEGQVCPQCGWQPRPKPKAVDVIDGQLGRLNRQRQVHQHTVSAGEKLGFYSQLCWIGRERGYKPGWAAHKFKEKFGEWPPRGQFEPTLPEAATLSWVRSRQIAYARALERRSA